MIDLIEFYPEHLKNPTIIEILRVLNVQLAEEEEGIENLTREFNISTATNSLPLWAKFVGIEYNDTIDVEIMRSNILAGLMSNQVTTVKVIKEIAEKYSNGTCEVIENYADYSFIVRFTSTVGIPLKIDEIQKSIDRVKPAHLNYKFEFIYRTWGYISHEVN